MAAGDIHNHNGTICKASKKPCPFGEDGHSKDIEAYIEHHVQESAVDGDSVRAMIADGTPPADAVEVAKAGHSAVANTASAAKVDPHWQPRGDEAKSFTALDSDVIRHSEELAESAGVNAAWIYLRQNGLKSNGLIKSAHLSQVISRTPGFHPEPQYPFSAENVAVLASAEAELDGISAERSAEDARIKGGLDSIREDQIQLKESGETDRDVLKYAKLGYANRIADLHGVAPVDVRVTKAGGYRVRAQDGEVTRYDSDFNMEFRGFED